MSEIYWITRLDAIHLIAVLVGVFGIIATIAAWVMYKMCGNKSYAENEYNFGKSFRWPLTIITSLGILIGVFVPDKKDMFMIWGIGGTLDYVQQNETIQNLPDKCVDALDAWVDSLTEEEE